MAELNPVIVPREACPVADTTPKDCAIDLADGMACRGCLGDGTRAVLDQAREVERTAIWAEPAHLTFWKEVQP